MASQKPDKPKNAGKQELSKLKGAELKERLTNAISELDDEELEKAVGGTVITVITILPPGPPASIPNTTYP